MINKSELKKHFLKNSDPARLWSRKEIFEEAQSNGIERKDAYNWFRTSSREGFITSVARGKYSFGEYSTPAPVATPAPAPTPEPVMDFKNAAPISLRSVSSVSDDEIYVPSKDATYIKWGEFSKIKKIIESKLFFPTYVAGMSGNGKTMMVEQACAILEREYVRVQVSPETDEDDLIGGFRLIDGETVFQKGPVYFISGREGSNQHIESECGNNEVVVRCQSSKPATSQVPNSFAIGLCGQHIIQLSKLIPRYMFHGGGARTAESHLLLPRFAEKSVCHCQIIRSAQLQQ